MIDEINGRLKAAKMGVAVAQIGDRLYLVATLPPKPKAKKTIAYQQRIALGIYANPAGFRQAEIEAKILAGKLASRSFDWKDYQRRNTEKELTAEIIEQFKVNYFKERTESIKAEATWHTEYEAVFKRLPQDGILTAKILIDLIESITPDNPNSRSRKRVYQALTALAKFADIPIDLSCYKSKYSPRSVNPRELPSDDVIQEWFYKIPNRSWQWVYGMLATFGLRPHEVFFVEPDVLVQESICSVTEGKTTGGRVWPLYPEWVDLFELKKVDFPTVNCRLHIDYGDRVSGAFYRYKIPFPPYALRHCWARRSIDFGLDSRLAAKQMRHDHSIHTSTYNLWIDEKTHQRAFDNILINPNRPKPPS